MALVYKCFAVKNGFYRYEPFSLEETLVTVSPCEFPPRGHLLSLDYKMESCDLFQKIIYIVYDIVLLKEISVKC